MIDLTAYDAYFFDLDGTIYIGDTLLPGASQLISQLREMNKKIMFLTNTTIHTRKGCLAKLQKLGLQPKLEEIVTAAYITCLYIREHFPLAKVFGRGPIGD